MPTKQGGLRGSLRNVSTGVDLIPDSGISRWTFDDADTESGTALDVWDNNDGTINGATTGVSGANQTYVTNEAYSFTTDDNVTYGDIYDASSNTWSYAGWILVDSYGGNQVVISNANTGSSTWQQMLRVQSDGNLYLYHNNDSGTDSVSLSGPATGSWAFVFAYYDATNDEIGLSLDAGTRTTTAAETSTTSTVDDWQSGEKADTNDQNWEGDQDDPRLYSKVLSTTEEDNLYNTGRISG